MIILSLIVYSEWIICLHGSKPSEWNHTYSESPLPFLFLIRSVPISCIRDNHCSWWYTTHALLWIEKQIGVWGFYCSLSSTKGSILYICFAPCLSLNNLSWRHFHINTHAVSSLFFIVWMCYNLFHQFYSDGISDCFQFFAITVSSAGNNCVHMYKHNEHL